MFALRNRSLALVAPLALAVSVFASAPASAQGVWEACEADVAKLCEGVEPGNGRILSCIYAHENSISEKCGEEFADFGDLLDAVFFEVATAFATCAPDLEKHCSDVAAGGGRLLTCLHDVQPKLEPECGAIVDELTGFADEE
ncbi:MAG: hypothetical protein C0606_05435 [Hyphomicrobiales bacterium]|nr:MAG: hypothetical protein C0606_05435 [Hyphomicrobiales bacterium]